MKKVKIGGNIVLEYDKSLPEGDKNIWLRKDLQPNSVIQNIYKEGTITINNKKEKLTSAVSPCEGYYLYRLIKLNKFTKILEVGMANGLSSLYMTQALKELDNDGKLISIDPFQDTQWHCVGKNHIKKANLENYHELIQEVDYFALPRVLKEHGNNSFDLIFIDGMHLFDYTLLDMFYAFMLIKINGVIVIDDIKHFGPAKCEKYFDTNYKFLKKINGPCSTVATYIKIKEDDRLWNFHKDF